MAKNSKHNNLVFTLGPILLALIALTALIKVFLYDTNIALFNPKGFVANEQMNLILLIVGILFAAAIPTLTVLYFIAWKYRETNEKPKRDPKAGNGKLVNFSIWAIPTTFMIICAIIMWPVTHQLEPQKKIAASAKPLTIQVIAQRWKWVFLYPEQQIATVNYVQIPTGTPVTFEITADEAPMSSFWIPNLGGMLYAMTGHVNSLNLMAETPGDYPGSSAEINGAGFADMKFTARVSSKEEFDGWVQGVKQQTNILDSAEYAKLVKPSEKNPSASYSAVEHGLYDTVLMKYSGAGHDHNAEASTGGHE